MLQRHTAGSWPAWCTPEAPASFFSELLLYLVAPSLYWCLGLFLPSCRIGVSVCWTCWCSCWPISLPVVRNIHIHQDLSEVTKSGLTVSSTSTAECILSGPSGLGMSSVPWALPRRSLPCSRLSLDQDSWRQIFPVKTKVKKALSTFSFSTSFVTRYLPLLPRAISHGILLNRVVSALLKSRVMILLFPLLFLQRPWTLLRSLQPRLPLTFTSLTSSCL